MLIAVLLSTRRKRDITRTTILPYDLQQWQLILQQVLQEVSPYNGSVIIVIFVLSQNRLPYCYSWPQPVLYSVAQLLDGTSPLLPLNGEKQGEGRNIEKLGRGGKATYTCTFKGDDYIPLLHYQPTSQLSCTVYSISFRAKLLMTCCNSSKMSWISYTCKLHVSVYQRLSPVYTTDQVL